MYYVKSRQCYDNYSITIDVTEYTFSVMQLQIVNDILKIL